MILEAANMINYAGIRGHCVGLVDAYSLINNDEQSYFIVMDHCGETLGNMLRRYQHDASKYNMDLLDAMRIIEMTARNLSACHRQKDTAHSDVKEDNIGVTSDEIKLLDLGGVVPIGTRPTWHTKRYTCPHLEQTGAIPSSDMYALGITLAKCLRTIKGKFPRALKSFLEKVCSEDDSIRFSNAKDMWKELTRLLEHWNEDMITADSLPHDLARGKDTSYDEFDSITAESNPCREDFHF
jgi:serine/threonine protein kinase